MRASEIEYGNVIAVHDSAIRPNPEFSRKPLDWFVGKVAKIALQTANSRVEHVWIRVERVDGNELEGQLVVEPVSLEEIQFGDVIRLRRTEISHVEVLDDE